MPFFLDTHETVQRFGSSIAEFRSLLDRNYVRYGSPDDLFEFANTLDHSNQFRLDLSALVKSVVNRERGELLLTDMMGIIAAAVGGQSVTETAADITRPTNTLMEFLLGTGCWKQFGAPSRPTAQRTTSPLPPPVRREEPEPIRISVPVSPVKSATGVPEDKTSLLEISNDLRQTLTRLENNTQQVKLHLDSIERRIGKMEATPEAPAADKTAGLEPLLHPAAVHAEARNVESSVVAQENLPIEPSLPIRGRAIFSGPLHLEEADTVEEDDFSSPTFAFGTENKRSFLPLVLFIVLAVIVAAGFFYVYSTGSLPSLKAGLARLEGKQSQGSSGPSPGVSGSEAHPPAASDSSSAGVSSPPSPSASQPNRATGEAASPPAHTASSDGASPAVSSGTPAAIPNNPKFRYVPANVMEGYLLSAPRPEYPAQARTNHIEGQVVLQASISRSGSITSLHVIKGPPSLRSAAIAAVRTWRYRPYSVNGQPQDVTTTVYVDFNFRPPPALVR